MIYDVDYFISKFEAIPHNMWTTGTIGTETGPKCALGHCRDWSQGFPFGIVACNSKEGYALDQLMMSKLGINVEDINDGCPSYGEFTPKARVLAALRDIKGT